MIPKTARLLTACLLVPLFGCSANQGVIRGQSQSGYSPNAMAAAEFGNLPAGNPAQVGPVHHEGPVVYWGADCPHGAWQGSGKPPKIWSPTHHHTYHYQPPQNLVYPPENQPAAIYQYPYYTVKSPTDFFYK